MPVAPITPHQQRVPCVRRLPQDDRASLRLRLGRCLTNPPWIGTRTLSEVEQIRMAPRRVRRLDKHVFCETPSAR